MKKEEIKQAIALKYDMEKDSVPKITASGQGVVAENIINSALEHRVAIHQDERLAKELIQFKVGTEIPPELYEIVAQILVFVDGIDKKRLL